MAKTATIRRMARPRGELTDQTMQRLKLAADVLEGAADNYRAEVIKALAEGSFSEVSKATGLSTNTLQRWKKEAAK